MKTYIYKLTAVAAVLMQLSCCADRFSSVYVLELPEAPDAWVSILGEPWWRVEWITTDGQKQTADFPPGALAGAEVEIPVTWTNPVMAWPYWHDRRLIPGIFKPAGALFPFDVNNGRLRLSWEAGIDTVFYRELIMANDQNISRIPANFNWSRFRELFQLDTTNEAVREDPWLVDWRSAAERTISSNFDRRRLVPQAAEPKALPVPAGIWYGTSPFAEPLFFAEGETPVFPVRPGINVWFSAEGILRVNGSAWMFTAWDRF